MPNRSRTGGLMILIAMTSLLAIAPTALAESTAGQAAAAIEQSYRYAPRTTLMSVEQTANLGGGTVWPVAALEAIFRYSLFHYYEQQRGSS